MKTEYTGSGGFLQRDGVEHKQYAEAYSAEIQKAEERDGADLLEKVLDRDNLNSAYRRVKANKGQTVLGCCRKWNFGNTITSERLARRGYYDISEAYKSLHSL